MLSGWRMLVLFEDVRSDDPDQLAKMRSCSGPYIIIPRESLARHLDRKDKEDESLSLMVSPLHHPKTKHKFV
jgi:hypothetical protein